MSNIKKSEVEIFVKMLEGSEEKFRAYPVKDETNVIFPDRKIIFIFDVNGKFSKITNIK